MSLFTTPNLTSTGSLNVTGFLAVPPLLNFIAEWAALIPLVCHLANYHHPHQLAGHVALLGRVSLPLFPKLGVLAGISKFVERGPEFLDIASTIGPSSRKVWDVKWGGAFPCANGAASGYLVESLLKHKKPVIKIPDSVPLMHTIQSPMLKTCSTSTKRPGVTVMDEACTSPGMASTIPSAKTPGDPKFRRYQTLHVLHFSKSPPLLSWLSMMDNFLASPIFVTATFTFKLGIVIVLCLFGIYGTAATLLSGSITQIVSHTIRINRPSGFLSSNEAHNGCMLVATHANASLWYLFVGDRGAIDSILNKAMVIIPQQRFAAEWFRIGDMVQLLAMTFVASQKGWDGVCLLALLLISTIANFRFRHELVSRMFCEENGVVIKQESFEFSGRTPMLGAIQQLSGSRSWQWMDDILVPCPRREVWAKILSTGNTDIHSFDEKVRNLTEPDKSSSATTGIALGTAVICKPRIVSNPNFWTIAPSGTGHCSFNLSAFPLGLNLPTPSQPVPVAGVGISGLDSSIWKLLKYDTGNYRIINKDNGLLLLQDSTGKVLLGPGDNKANQQNEWKLYLNPPKPSTAVSIPAKSADRELQPTNGLYLFSNSQSSNVFTMSTPTIAPMVTPRDLEASSVEGRKQVWIVEMNRDNCFTIKSFPFGMSLAFNDSTSSLVFGSDDGSISFQWKFLQDTATSTMRIVPRNRPNLVIALDLNSALSLVSYSDLPLQRWTMSRSSGTSADTNLAQGVYTISLYQAPNPFGLQTQASTVSVAVQNDKQYNKNLNTIADSASDVASGLTSTFPAPALPADVILGTVLDTLETSDFKDAPAALGIASWFYATLNGVTKAALPAAPAASTRVMAISDSLVKISQIIVNASTIGSAITAASGAKQINDITSTTSLLTDTSSQGLQNGILAAAQQFLSGLNTYIQTLPPPASLATDVDPSTPSTISQGDGDNSPVIRSPLAAQSFPQYWFVASAGADLFTISHLTSKKYLAYDKTTASSTQQGKIILQTNAYNWRFTNQRLGGYAIISAVDSNIAICMPVASSDVNGETFVADGTTGAQRQRWSLLRSGYYLQNQEPQNWNKVVTKNATGNDVFLTPYRPFGANTLLNGIRSNALCIWHLVKVNTGKYCFYNEASRTVLRNGGDNVVVVAGDLQQERGDIWQFAKNGNDMWFAPGNANNQKWMSTNGADSQTIVVNDPGGKESWKGWQLISVAATERGILMNLPRCILNPRNRGSGNLDASLVVSIDPQNPSGPFVQRQYKPDDSHQRFRIYTYAKYSFYINEATASIVKAGGGTADLSGVADQSAWFTSDSSQNISCLQSNVTPLFANAISNTGDLGSLNLSVRIQIGKVPGDTSVPPRVLSVDSTGTPIAEPWDRFSAQQAWSYLDWDKGRYIIHTPTSKLLALSGNSLVLLAPGSYTQEALWKNDYSQASTAGINGFFPIQPATPSTSMIPTGIIESNGALTISALPQFGFRLILDSSWFFFTDRLALLNTFLTSHNPVFCHAKGTPLPISVDSYLASSTINNGPVPTPLPTLPGDYVLTYSGPPSNGSSAVAYIVVRSATEPIYINYTDISYYLLYPPSLSPSTTGGWTYITMRFNNYSNLLSSVYFPSLGWIYNLDLSTDPSATNPLSIIKRADGTTKLHVKIGTDLQPVPGFGTMLNSDIINATNWGFVLDSSQSANNVLLEAGMIRDDKAGSRPLPPSWARYKGAWMAGGGAGSKFPGAV